MKHTFLTLLLTVLTMNISAHTETVTADTNHSPVDWVNTLMGSDSSYELSNGNTYPAIAMPWGMNFWTPQTGRMGDGWVYTYRATRIMGFKQSHQPSPWINDYGQFSIMPGTGRVTISEDDRASWFSHKAETATPYYYSVYLADHDVTTELTPTERACRFRITYPQSEQSWIVVDAFDGGSMVTIDTLHNCIKGYATKNSGGVADGYKNFFVISFSRPFTYVATASNGELHDGSLSAESNHSMAVVGWQTGKREQIEVKVASSFISEEQAWRNLRELDCNSFDEQCLKGKAEWNRVLGRIAVEGGSESELRTFYSCLYRSLLFPRKLYEYTEDGKAYHRSPYNGNVCEGYLFGDTGFWDTFRSLFPLLNLMYPEVAEEMQEGLANAYRESGFLPEWSSPGHRDCMVGNNSASVVADAYLKGIRTHSTDVLWEAVVHGANAVHPQVSSTGRLGYEQYNRLGYVPYDSGIRENVARTLEYAYDDWCIYQFGKALGKSEKELKPFQQRAYNYTNVFDPSTLLMRGRNADGSFAEPFNPLRWGDAFTEGNAWHYTWSVFHDPNGLIKLMGSKEKFCEMLDSVFNLPPVFDESYYGQVIHEIREMQIMNMGNYAHGNQPIQHMIYLYNYAGEPWKAQYHVRNVMNRLYKPTPDGYCGDEDNGQTSAWYVFSALGFYPVCPGSNQYVLGSPLFEKATLHLKNGKVVTISAQGNAPAAPYIEKMEINGKLQTRNYLQHEELMKGCHIGMVMSEQPNINRGTKHGDLPYSMTKR